MSKNVLELEGRIVKVRKLGKNLTFAILLTDFKEVRLVFYFTPKIKKNDWVKIRGVWKVIGDAKELNVLDFQLISNFKNINTLNEYLKNALKTQKFKKLLLRAKVISNIHSFFRTEDFKLVTSPSIVGDWVKGQTGSFLVDFYGNTAYLSISNMLYHHVYACLGFSKFYEISKLFRQEKPSNKKRLAEFTILDFSIVNSNLEDLMRTTENLIESILNNIEEIKLFRDKGTEKLSFERIKFSELLEKVGIEKMKGHQFNSLVKKFLMENYNGFVWVTNFPKSTRPFYVKCKEDVGFDCQLWYQGVNFLAAGGERERDREIVKEKILFEGKNVDNYQLYLDCLNLGIPKMCSIGLGIERFISVITKNTTDSDFISFPVYQGNLKH